MPRVGMKLNMNRKGPRGRPILRWLDNIDHHKKGNNTSLKEVMGTKCFKNLEDWRILISRLIDRISGEDPLSPTWSMVSEEQNSLLLQRMIQCMLFRCNEYFVYIALEQDIGSNGKQLVPGQGASSLQPGLLHPDNQ